MFSGLRSRCTTPMSCATASAASVCVRMSTMRAAGERPVLARGRARRSAPVEELHRDVEQAVGLLAEVDDADRVRVVEARRGLRLALEARRERGVARRARGASP